MKKLIYLVMTLVLGIIFSGFVAAADNPNVESVSDPATSTSAVSASPTSASQLQVDVYDNPDPVVAGNL